MPVKRDSRATNLMIFLQLVISPDDHSIATGTKIRWIITKPEIFDKKRYMLIMCNPYKTHHVNVRVPTLRCLFEFHLREFMYK